MGALRAVAGCGLRVAGEKPVRDHGMALHCTAMSAILDLPEVRDRVGRISVEAYEQLGECGKLGKDVELIRGIILQQMPLSPVHRKLAKRLYDRFLAHNPVGGVVFQEAPLRLLDSEPRPDVMIVQGQESDFDEVHPVTAELVVEVAVSTIALDRENASLYAESGVKEYWIVLALERQIEVYRQPENGVYRRKRLFAIGETLICESVPNLAVPLEELFR